MSKVTACPTTNMMSSSTTNNTALKQSMTTQATINKPRKKFNLRDEISLAARKTQIMTNGWNFKVNRKIMDMIGKDLERKFLWVQGSDIPFFKFNYLDMLNHMELLPPPQEKLEKLSGKLCGIPLYSGIKFRELNGKTISDTGTTQDFINRYEKVEYQHKSFEDHHPDSTAWKENFNNLTVQKVFEAVFDLHTSLLKKFSSHTAWKHLFTILKEKDWTISSPFAVYAALLHFQIRGISNCKLFRESINWRKYDPLEHVLHHKQFLHGAPPDKIMAGYKRELDLHIQAVTGELRRCRIGKVKHDWSKLRPESQYYYAWKWGVWEQLPPVFRHRILSGCSDPNPPEQVTFTGMTDYLPTPSNMAKNAASSASGPIGEMIDEKIEKLGERMETSGEIVSQNFCTRAKEVLSEFFERGKTFTHDMALDFQNKATSIIGSLPDSLLTISNSLSALQGFVDNALSGIRESMKDIIPEGLKLDASAILNCLKYYILMINTDNSFLKGILFLLALNSIGALTVIYEYMLKICSYMFGSEGGDIPQFTSGTSWFEKLFTSTKYITSLATGLLGSLFSGRCLTGLEFGSLLSTVSNNLKHFHFIAQGTKGLVFLYQSVRDLIKKVCAWVSVRILGRTDEKKAIASRVASWCLLVRYFVTETGMMAIRLSANARGIAEGLYQEGQTLLLLVGSTGKNPSIELQRDIMHHWGQVRTIENYLARRRAMTDFQPTMFHVQFFGKPGIGKSTLTKTMTNDLLTKLWDGKEKGSFYSWNSSLDHFDGYCGQKIMLIDDIFRMNEPKHLTTLIGLITNTPVLLPMANLEDKGCQLTSEILVTSTNTPYPVGKDVLCMEAIYRRRHLLVHVTCDPEVCDPASNSFSPDLFKNHPNYGKANPPKRMTEFPHLKFHLVRPVPERLDRLTHVETTSGEIAELVDQLTIMNGINKMFYDGQPHDDPNFQIPPEFLYQTQHDLPEGISFPCTDWSYQNFMAHMIARFSQFRSNEAQQSISLKYSEATRHLSELNAFVSTGKEKLDLENIRLVEPLLSQMHFRETTDEIEEVDMKMASGLFTAPDLESVDIVKFLEEKYKISQTPDIAPDIDPVFLFTESLDPVEGPSTNPEFTGKIDWDEKQRIIDESIERENRHKRRIMERLRKPDLGKVVYDPMDDVLQVVPGKGLRIDRPFTVWAEIDEYKRYMHPKNPMGFRSNLAAESKWLDDMIDKFGLEDYINPDYHDKLRALERRLMSRMMYIPNTPEFSLDIRNKKTDMSIHFLQNVSFHDDVAYYNFDRDEHFTFPFFLRRHPKEVTVHFDGKPYQIELDQALLWSLNPMFMIFVTEFSQFGLQQRKALVREAKWRNKYTGFYTMEALEEFFKDSVLRHPIHALSIISDPIYHLHDIDPIYFTIVFSTMGAIAAFFLFKEIAGLFFPKTQPTSKYLHRGPKSNVKTNIKFTGSTILNDNARPTNQVVQSLLRRNIRQVSIAHPESNKVHKLQALCSGQYMFINRHGLMSLPEGWTAFYLSMESPDCKSEWDFQIEKEWVYEDPEGDLAIIHSKHFPCARTIDSALLTQEELRELEFDHKLIFLSVDKQTVAISDHKYLMHGNKLMEHQGIKLKDYLLVIGETMVGKSGSTVIYPRPIGGRISILGVQAWQLGNFFTSKIAIQLLSLEKYCQMIDSVNSQMEEIPIERIEDFEDEIVENICGFTSQSFNNIVCEVPKSEAVGTVGKTAFKMTPIAELMIRDGHESNRVPACLNPNDPNLVHGKKIHPMNKSFNKYFKDRITCFDEDRLLYIEDSLVSWFQSRLDKKKFSKLTLEETITGTREDGSNPMALTTSPGIPYVFEKHSQKGKRDYFNINEDGEVDYISPRIREEYAEFKSLLMQGKLPLTRSYDFPKDELRPIEKAYGSIEKDTPPNTRSVTCMNMLYILLWRELTLDMWASFHRIADGTFPLCPGINPEGPEWSNAMYYLDQFPNVCDFDVSNWDGFVMPTLMFTAGRIVSRLNGYELNSPEELAIRAICTEVMFGYIQHGTIIYQKYRGMISGFPGTAEMNSLIHLILSIYIYLNLTDNTPYCYFQSWLTNTATLIYGDDIIVSISDEVFEYYNGLSIPDEYKRIGYPVTPADKSDTFKKCRKLEECSFLKSSWIELSPMIYVRKMDIEVAYDLLYWVRANEQPKEQFYNNLTDALRIVFGHGKQKYNAFLRQLNSWLKESGNPTIHIQYDDLYYDHMRKYYVDLL